MYKIRDKRWQIIRFKMNKSQIQFYNRMEVLNEDKVARDIILKARQLGMTTFALIFALDKALFTKNFKARFITETGSKAMENFLIVKLAVKEFPIKELKKCNGSNLQSITFENGSSVKISMGLRWWTVDFLHISELAKIWARFPKNEKEIMTGSAQAVWPGWRMLIESTAEWTTNKFAELCTNAMNKEDGAFNFHFFPWYEDDLYRTKYDGKFVLTDDEISLKQKLFKEKGYLLSDEQLYWRRLKKKDLQDEFEQEYPTFPEDAFLVNSDCWYNSEVLKSYDIKKGIRDKTYKDLIFYNLKKSNNLIYWIDISEWIGWDYAVIRCRTRDGKLVASYRDNYTDAADLCKIVEYMFNKGLKWLVAPERNNHGHTFLLESKKYSYYRWLYKTREFDTKINKQKISKLWFETTAITRPLILDDHRTLVNNKLIEIDRDLQQEMYIFAKQRSWKVEANTWWHDDVVMADMICCYMRHQRLNLLNK